MLNIRIKHVLGVLENLNFNNILDVGCRDCSISKAIEKNISYYGCDLFQNNEKSVAYVGNFMDVEFDRTFDCVIALDIVEHVDDPYILVDKLFELPNRYVIVSLPNCYDIRHKYLFCFKNTLGNKYTFNTYNSLDRHRWLMNYDEIILFYKFCANKFNSDINISYLKTGLDNTKLFNRVVLFFLSLFLSKKDMTSTIFCIFEKKNKL